MKETGMATNSDDQQSGAVREVTVRWAETVEQMPTSYANHLFISHAGPEFFLIFGVVTPPAVVPGSEHDFEDLQAVPVAKIAVSPETIVRMARTIEENVQKYMGTKELREKELFQDE
jgi:hypothetical protein